MHASSSVETGNHDRRRESQGRPREKRTPFPLPDLRAASIADRGSPCGRCTTPDPSGRARPRVHFQNNGIGLSASGASVRRAEGSRSTYRRAGEKTRGPGMVSSSPARHFQVKGAGENVQRTDTPRGRPLIARRRLSMADGPSVSSRNGPGHALALRPQRRSIAGSDGNGGRRTQDERPYAAERIRETHRAPVGVEQTRVTAGSGRERSRSWKSTPSPWATFSEASSRSRNLTRSSGR
jgi:hypothetical protein